MTVGSAGKASARQQRVTGLRLLRAAAFNLKDTEQRKVLPLGRRVVAAREADTSDSAPFEGTRREPGARGRL